MIVDKKNYDFQDIEQSFPPTLGTKISEIKDDVIISNFEKILEVPSNHIVKRNFDKYKQNIQLDILTRLQALNKTNFIQTNLEEPTINNNNNVFH